MFPSGSLVWAKVRGYPWWPGRVKSLSDAPKELGEHARTSFKKESVVTVHFFGSHDFALVPVDSLKPLKEDFDSLASKSSGGKFKQAVKEAKSLLGKVAVEPEEISSPMAEEEKVKKEELPTNAFIVIDPETGAQTVKKRRGRPPKKRPEDFPLVQYGQDKTDSQAKTGKKAATLLKMSELERLRKKIQKILLRPKVKSKEIPIAQEIIRIVFDRKRCSIEQLEKSKMGYVLVMAMKRKVWEPYPDILKSFKKVLSKWKSLPESL